MTGGRQGVAGIDGPRGSHTLLVADDVPRVRLGTAAWLGHALARGAKVYYKGWCTPDEPDGLHWLAHDGPAGTRAALDSGQLEVTDYRTVIERCGGTADGLHRLVTDEVRGALAEGYAGVAMTQETAQRPMDGDADAAELVAQEGGYARLAVDLPVTVLCQLVTAEEHRRTVWESVSVHHGDLVDGRWSARSGPGWWQLRGELDAPVGSRFGAAVYGALARARRTTADGCLHVDLGTCEFLDLACAQILLLTCRAAPDDQPVVLHRVGDPSRRVLEAIGVPRGVTFTDAPVPGVPRPSPR